MTTHLLAECSGTYNYLCMSKQIYLLEFFVILQIYNYSISPLEFMFLSGSDKAF